MKHYYIKFMLSEKDIMTLNAYRVCNDRSRPEESEIVRQLEKEAEDIVRESFWSVVYACKGECEERLLGKAVHDFLEERATSEENEEGGS